MNAITPVADNAYQLGETIVQLEGLVAAYSAILEQAKAQLENLELTPDQLQQISINAAERIDRTRLMSSITIAIEDVRLAEREYGDDFRPHDHLSYAERHAYNMLDAITRKVNTTIATQTLADAKREFEPLIKQLCQDRLDAIERRITDTVTAAVEARYNIEELQNRDAAYHMRNLLQSVYTPQQLSSYVVRATQDQTPA